MNFTPSTIAFGVVAPGSGAARWTQSTFAMAAPTEVTASILDDTSGGAFTVAEVLSLALVTEYESDPGVRGGRPVKVTTLDTVARSNGIVPLTVGEGNFIAVEVDYQVPQPPVVDAPTATLEIQGNGTALMSLPITAEVGAIAVAIPPIAIQQNQSVMANAVVRLVAGPATTVLISTDATPSPNLPVGSSYLPPGIFFSVTPGSVQLSPTIPAAPITLRIGAALPAAPGTYALALNTSAFNGTMYYFQVVVQVTPLTLRPTPLIAEKYAELGGPDGILGESIYPVEFCADEFGQFEAFVNGVIYWAGPPAAQAFEVHGPVLDYILWEQPPTDPGLPPTREQAGTGPFTGLGYPVSDVLPVRNVLNQSVGNTSRFAKGSIFWNNSVGTHALSLGPIQHHWLAEHGGAGRLGFPIGNGGHDPITNKTWVDFENGVLFSTASNEVGELGMIKNGKLANGFSKQFILDKLSQVIQEKIATYDTSIPPPDYPVYMRGGPSFVDASMPVTDYSSEPSSNSPESSVRNRMYHVEQEIFAQQFFGDVYIHIIFDILINLGGPVPVRTPDASGNPITRPSDSSLLITVQNVIPTVSTQNPFVDDSDKEQAKERVYSVFSQARIAIALPSGISYVSAKVFAFDDPTGLFSAGDLGILFLPLA